MGEMNDEELASKQKIEIHVCMSMVHAVHNVDTVRRY